MKERIIMLCLFSGLIWAISIFELFFYPGQLIPALIPRTRSGLIGVITMPFIHGNMNHLLANTLPLLIFTWLILNRGVVYFMKTTIIVLLLGGICVWLFARTGAHIGASGLIFGYFGFLVARCYYDKSLRSLIITMVVVFYYGGIVWGIVPTECISWEAHLFGLMAGMIAAKYLQHKTGDNLV